MSVTWTEADKEIAGIKLHVARSGSGPTVLVLHHDIGTVDRLLFLRRARGEIRCGDSAPSRLGQVRAAAMDAPSPRHRRDVCLAAGGSRRYRRVIGGPRFWRLDRRRNGKPGASSFQAS